MFKFLNIAIFVIAMNQAQSHAADSGFKCPPKGTTDQITKSKQLYTNNCMSCHGAKGDGLGDSGKYMQPKPRNLVIDKFKNGASTDALFATLTKGLAGTGMGGFPTLPNNDRCLLVYYVQSLRRK